MIQTFKNKCKNYLVETYTFNGFIYLFLEQGEGREKERERSINVWLPLNPGMCPDWELNWRPFGLQAGTQSTELHQSG